ncbi:MAG: cellobiose phosphorylase [Gemmatimonadetes bacterium]|nr:cellobiose phosphorylase [Gemmatimonadota bacterium]
MGDLNDRGSTPSLEDIARDLARTHAVVPARWLRARIRRRVRVLQEVHTEVTARLARGAVDQPLSGPAEWLLDNQHLIAEALQQVRQDLTPGFYRELPRLAGTGLRDEPRVFAVGRALVEEGGGHVDPERARRFLGAYQDVAPMTMGELWAFPAMLRLAVLEDLAAAGAQLVDVLFHERRELRKIAWEYRHAPVEERVPGGVRSLRTIAAEDWKLFFEAVSRVEQLLRAGDPVGAYSRMDFETRDRYRKGIEEIARRTAKPEELVAREATRLARDSPRGSARERHIGYLLIDRGRARFEKALGYRPSPGLRVRRLFFPLALPAYVGAIAALTIVALRVVLSPLLAQPGSLAAMLLALASSLVPATAVAVAIVHWIVTNLVPPRVLPKMDYEDEIPEEARTWIVTPVLLGSREELDELLRQLELNWMGNGGDNVRFAVLADFPDAAVPSLPEDRELLDRLSAGIEELNGRYGAADSQPFLLLHRARRWNPSEGRWMGWERKRGKLFGFNSLILEDEVGEFAVAVGDASHARGSRYVMTLDADTFLPRGAARRLVATLDHPLNRPEFDPQGRLRAGYTVLQPRVELRPTDASRTLFSRIFEADRGLDLYSRAVSNVYQDLFGVGIYVGKGIYDVAAFERTLRDRIPENRLLSHDLFEGIHGRAGLVSDVAVFEEFPDLILAYLRRLHRWVRGDWQIAPWLLPAVPSAAGPRMRNPIGFLGRLMILDNLRRSLLFPSLVILAVAGSAWLPGPAWWWTAAVLGALAMPLLLGSPMFFRLRAQVSPVWAPMASGRVLAATGLWRWILSVVFLPYRAYVEADAIARTLVRLLITRKHLLEWTTHAQAGRAARDSQRSRAYWVAAAPGPAVAAAAVAVVAAGRPAALVPLAPLLLAWLVSPQVAAWISRAQERKALWLNAAEIQRLRVLARRTWGYFEHLVGADDHWLPPDHWQEDPRGEVAHRTSPTNIGLMLGSTLSAYDLGYVTASELTARLSNSFEQMQRLERYRGHFLNWYQTRDLSPLEPRYVSTVDSGNLLAALVSLKQALAEIAETRIPRAREIDGILDVVEVVRQSLDAVTSAWAQRKPVADILARIAQRIRLRERDPAAWLALCRALEEEDLPALDVAVDGLIAPGETRFDPGALARLRTWLRRLRHQVAAACREAHTLVPWLASLAEAPAHLRAGAADPALRRAYQALEDDVPPACVLREVPAVCDRLRRRLTRLAQVAGAPGEDATRLAVREWIEPFHERLDRAAVLASRIHDDIAALCWQAEAWIVDTDFQFLFEPRRKLFRIGYFVTTGERDQSFYDLLASEARIASMLAVAKGDVPAAHWLHLGRPFGKVAGKAVLLSWAGTMFEYLMPSLLARSPDGTLLDLGSRQAIRTQIRFARRRGIPWGISESAYDHLDAHGTYQYRAFGVPELSIRRDPGSRIVVSPYASVLALSFAPLEVSVNLERLAALGMMGEYGLYEALDFGRSDGRPFGRPRVVRSFMAHHQGMILLALANHLTGHRMVSRFHRDPRVAAVEYLLYERAPGHVRLEPRPPVPSPQRRLLAAATPVESWTLPADGVHPQAQVLSNGPFSVIVTRRGGGAVWWKGRAMTRWSPDAADDRSGTWLYLQDLESQDLWSPAPAPMGTRLDGEAVVFGPHRAEWSGSHRGIASRLDVTVPPGADVEIRRLVLRNDGTVTRRLRITSYGEPVLAEPRADERHPVFNKLFIEAQYRPDLSALVFHRRRAAPEEPGGFLAHGVSIQGIDAPVSYEADRARFLGRTGSPRDPEALRRGAGLSGTVGATLDPIFSLSVPLELEPGRRVELCFLTAAGETEGAVLAALDAYRSPARWGWAFGRARESVRARLLALGLAPDRARDIQQLVSALLYPYHASRTTSPATAGAIFRRDVLWALGISGDHPILLVGVTDPEDTAPLAEMLRMHAWLRDSRLHVDLVVLDESPSGYAQPLLQWLRRTLARLTGAEHLGPAAGVHYVSVSRLSEPEREALRAAAALHLRVPLGPWRAQLDALAEEPLRLPPFVPVPSTPVVAEPTPPVERPPDLRFDNGLGGFTRDGREYVIHLEGGHATPAPWINVVASPVAGFTVSERGSGFTWAVNSGEFRLSTWSNDPVLDSPGEALYLRDEETAAIWSPTPGPKPVAAPYQVRHGAGYSTFHHRSHGLDQQLRLFVARREPVKILELRLENLWNRARRVTATYFVEWVLGAGRAAAAPHVVTEFDHTDGILTAENRFAPASGPQVAFLATGDRPHGWTADRREFLGRGGPADPEALHRIGLAGRAGAGLDPCGALQVHVDLAPGETRTVHFFLGAADSPAAAAHLVRELRAPGAVQARWHYVTDFWEDMLGRIEVRTPDPALDLFLNRWAPYQTLACRLWGRSGLYQSSGAFGFRDQLQDALAFLHCEPSLAREQIVAAARHQFQEGDVLHWWHPPRGAGIRTRCSDDLLWLPFAVASYVEATADRQILAEPVPFLAGPPLAPQEMERYGQFTSGPVASLYEHCLRALHKGMTRGRHGLPLMGSGDWNDGMNRVGRGGRGESVWLGWFACATALRFACVCDLVQDEPEAARLRAAAQDVRAKLEEFAWDGEWYVRATYDDGTILGSKNSVEARIDSLSQSWAVLSGVADPARARTAMESVWRELVKLEERLVLLLAPPFERSAEWPGYIKAYPPGIRENGGQYAHAGTWVAWAFARLGDGVRAHEVFRILNPVDRALTPRAVRHYRVEPYVIAGDVGGAPPHRGRGGWTWYTGAAGWMLRLGLEALLGLRPARGGFRFHPCIPPTWPEYDILLRRGGARYAIRVLNPDRVSRGVQAVEIDGTPVPPRDVLDLPDDGRAHRVVVYLGSGADEKAAVGGAG